MDAPVTTLETVEVETGRNPTAAVIWLHGLGADGHDFEPIVPELVRPRESAVRFVFPHAPVRPVTLNSGYPMRAWYDIRGLDRHSEQDETGIRDADSAVRELIKRENERGIPTNRIVLAGFSQGGAMALYTGTRLPQQLAGIMGLSCYLLLGSQLIAERSEANGTTPIFMAHGIQDPMVSLQFGDETRRALEDAGYAVEWHTYPMPHAVCPEEIEAIAEWLKQRLGD
jgi:phospholipase/carboxylesterase